MAIVLVNKEKADRAQHIINLLSGTARPKDGGERERIEHYNLALHGIDLKSPEALEKVYAALGGLTRTEAEQKAAEVKAVEAKKEGRKNQMGLKPTR